MSKRFSRYITAACAAAASMLVARTASASIVYTTLNSTYSQNFDSLPNTPENVTLGNSPTGWQDDIAAPAAGNFSIVGWYLFHPASLTEGGFSGHQRMRIGAGSANTGAFMSFGTSGSTERALGSLVSSTTVTSIPGQQYMAMRVTNNVGFTLEQFTLSYDGEQWRDGGNATPTPVTMSVEYSTTASAINDTPNFSPTTGLDFTTPVNGTSASSGFGNTTGKVSVGPVTVTGLNWQPGTDLWIRWKDPRISGNNPGIAIDNVQFIGAPEPGSLTLVAGAAAAVLGMRRRQAR